jgi:hypothetical protein
MRVTITQVAQAAAGHVDEIAVTRLSSRIITAVRTGSGLKVIVWDVGADGALTRRGDAPAGGVTLVAITDWPQGPGVVTAVRTSSGDLKVIAWKVGADGSVQRAGDDTAGPVGEVAISSPAGFAGVVTPVRTASGELKVIAWKVSAAGAVTRAGDASGGACSAISVTALSSADGVARVATALRNQSGNLEVITFAVAGAGTVTRLHEGVAGPISDVAITYRATANADLVTVTRGPSGDLTVIGWAVKDDGSLQRLASAQGGDVARLAVVTWKPDVHSYVVASLRTGDSGKLKLVVWRNGADLKRHGELTDVAVQDVALTTWSNGVVTAARNAAGSLHLTSWSLKPAGIRLLHRESPAPAASAQAAPSQTKLAVEPQVPMRAPQAGARYGERPIVVTPQPSGDGDPEGSDTLSPPWQKRFFPGVSGVDPMLAVGHEYVVVTQDHRIAFLDREGAPLASKAGEATNLSATKFFEGFIAATNPDGTPNPDNINLYSPQQISEFYDTRVAYDAATKRFAILSAARKPGTTDTRFFAFAVSKTEDPRDGFHQYMTTESNYRDFPRLTVHGNRLLVAHNAAGQAAEGETPVVYAFDYPSLRQGVLEPPNWQYYPSDLDGAARVFLVSHQGDSGGLTLLVDIRKDDAKLRIPVFPVAGQPWLAPTPLFTAATLSSQAPWPGPFVVYREKSLYLAGNVQITDRVPNVAPPRYSIRTIRLPFSTINTGQITVNAAAIVDRVFGLNAPTDAPGDKVTYDFPGVAVNKHGDAIYVYGRTGVETEAPLFPEARYTLWLHGEPKQRRSSLLQVGSYQPMWTYDSETVPTSVTHINQLDYATAVVDPIDDETFWLIHEYADDATKSWKTVVGVVSPSTN